MVASSPEPDPVVAALRAAGCVFAEEEAAALRAEWAGPELEVALARRVAGEPLEQVRGWAGFCGLRIRVVPGVFVPRRRSEAIVDLVVEAVDGVPAPCVVDLCCGTGAIGAAVATRVPQVELHAADLDPDAVACARSNVRTGEVHHGDLYDALPPALRGRVDVLAVNAPYVPTADLRLLPPEARLHEHRAALDGGADGLDVHRRVAAGAAAWLRPGGTLLVETSRAQAEDTAGACAGAGLGAEVLVRGDATVVRAISVGSPSSGTMTR